MIESPPRPEEIVVYPDPSAQHLGEHPGHDLLHRRRRRTKPPSSARTPAPATPCDPASRSRSAATRRAPRTPPAPCRTAPPRHPRPHRGDSTATPDDPTRYPTNRSPTRASARTTTTACATPTCATNAASISPSSIPEPAHLHLEIAAAQILQLAPRRLHRTRSPVRYIRSPAAPNGFATNRSAVNRRVRGSRAPPAPPRRTARRRPRPAGATTTSSAPPPPCPAPDPPTTPDHPAPTPARPSTKSSPPSARKGPITRPGAHRDTNFGGHHPPLPRSSPDRQPLRINHSPTPSAPRSVRHRLFFRSHPRPPDRHPHLAGAPPPSPTPRTPSTTQKPDASNSRRRMQHSRRRHQTELTPAVRRPHSTNRHRPSRRAR